MHRLAPAPIAFTLLLAGCSSDGSGTLAVRVTGEDAAKEGLPLSHDGEVIDFADGWTVDFDRWLVVVGDITVANSDGDEEADDGLYVADLHRDDPELTSFGSLAARRWDRVSFAVRGADNGETLEAAGAAADADVAMLQADGANLLVSGTASKGDRTVTFAWPMTNPSHNRDCTSGIDGTAGVVVRNNTTVTAEITFHVEHMFWDKLGSEQTLQRFDAIAAMADADGVIDFDALADQRLADLRDADGAPLVDETGAPLVYDPGSVPVDNLRDFILAAMRTAGHLDGEGLCTIDPL